jgi:NTE family protein
VNSQQRAERRPKIGLVLGAGGPIGHAFHAGVLAAIERNVGFDARLAALVVGTSAGAQVAALLRAGMTGEDLVARAAGEPLSEAAQAIAQNFVRPCHKTPDASLPKSAWPASPQFLLHSLPRPRYWRPGRVVAALLPEGRVRLDAQSAGLQAIFGFGWPERETLITAVDLDRGERIAFGAAGAPSIDLGTAVSCSSAVPGVYKPVEWQGRRYVDGGVASGTHLDLLAERLLDLVIVSSPLSMFGPIRALVALERRRLERSLPVLLIEPEGELLALMGRNPMDLSRAAAVARAAREATQRKLESREASTLLRLAF